MASRVCTIPLFVLGVSIFCPSSKLSAAIFSGNARIHSRSQANLTWDATKNALSVSCWFKLAVPSGTTVPEDMTILVNQQTYAPDAPFAYLIRFNAGNGNIEFVTRGAGIGFTNTLIERPYLERWYHVSVVRSDEDFWTYVDGRHVLRAFRVPGIGNTANGEGLTVGGWHGGRYLFGEVQEVVVAQVFRSQDTVKEYMFKDQLELGDLTGYFKLGFSTNSTNHLKDFVSGTSATDDPPDKVKFEETDQSGEQSAFDSRRNGGRDAVSPLSAAFTWEHIALSRPTPGAPFDLQCGYSSANAFGGFKLGSTDPFDAGPLGPGWRHTFETRLIRSDAFDPGGSSSGGAIGLMNWNGSIETWDLDLEADRYKTRQNEYRGELLKVGSARFHWVTPQRLVYVFQHPALGPSATFGRLLEIHDFNSNSVKILWSQSSGLITQVVDSARATFQFNYNDQRQLTNIGFGSWSVNFGYQSNRLAIKTTTNSSELYTNINTTWRFMYDSSNRLLQAIIDPRGNTNVFVQYDQYGRKTNEVDALGRATQTRYGVPGQRQITHVDPGTNVWIETYDRKGRITAQQDPLTNVTRFAYDERGNRTSVVEPLRWTTLFHYDEQANVIARTNALGEITRWKFDPQFNKATNEVNALGWENNYQYDGRGNLLVHSDGIGTLVRYEYFSNGLVRASIDGNGNTTRFGYDPNGFLIGRTNAAGSSTTYGYNDLGWKTSETNALSHATTFHHDLNGNVTRMVDSMQRLFIKAFDANGNLTHEFDAKGQLTSYNYDAANQKTNMVDRTRTNAWSYFYNSRGKLERVTNPLGQSTTNFYDSASRLVKIADPLGQSIRREYDSNGNEVTMIDQVNERWTKVYDRLNRVRAETNPLGDTRETTYDPAGRISQIFTPNGHPSTHHYDGRGRLTNWVDAEGMPWKYAYDGNANIVDITDALDGHYIMAYGPRNERIFEQNQDTNVWRYTYDKLLRLETQQDPNGTTRSLFYDRAGRLDYVRFNTGRINSLSYDENNNVVELERFNTNTVVTSTLDYDAMDRLTSYFDDVIFYEVAYCRDALGRVASIIYPGEKALAQSFDALGRLTNQVFHFSASRSYSNSYAYDNAGRLISRVYPNGIVQSNAFDNAGRITGLSYRPTQIESNRVNIAFTYAYDRNGNKTGSTERGSLDWQIPTLTDEFANYTAAGKLTTREIRTVPPSPWPSPPGEGIAHPGTWTYHYDPSGNMTRASKGTESYTLVYDEDNRTTSIDYTSGSTNVDISNIYDALGRRVSRTLNDAETLYVLDVAGDMERVLCDLDENDAISAWYIHGPDLAFKIDPNGNLLCYHSDAQANIIATSGSDQRLLHQYAYTPYGRLLGSHLSTNTSQPFLFVGSQGVMEELPGLYFMRARYYSADAAVFLSTDPVKKIGPGWKSVAYEYAHGNALRYSDPKGEFAHTLAMAGAFALRGAAFEIGHQAVMNLAHGRNVFDVHNYNGATIASAAVSGAVEGTLTSFGLVGPLADGAGDFAGEIVRQVVAGENFDFSEAVQAGLEGTIIGAVTDAFPTIGRNGNMYFGDVRGRAPKSALKSAFGYHGMQAALKSEAFAVGMNVGRTVATSSSTVQQSVSAGKHAQIGNLTQATSPRGPVPNSVGTSGAGGVSTGGGSISYTVKAGDTLGNIGYRHGSTASAIGSANGIGNLNLIRPGQVLTIPRR